MSDSRSYSIKQFTDIKLRVERQNKIILFLLSALLSLILVLITRDPGFNPTQDYVLFILFFAVGLWVTEAIPPFAVGILIIGFLVFTMGQIGNMDVNRYVQTWSDGVIWLFLGGFFLAEGMKKSKLDFQLLQFTVPKLGKESRYILLGFMLLSAILSMVMSNTATTVMVLAALAPIIKSGQNSIQKPLLLGVAGASAFGGMGTIIGSAPNAIAVGALESIGIKISFVEWMMFGIPVALLLTFLFWWFLLKKYKLADYQLDLSYIQVRQAEQSEHAEEEKIKKRIVLIVFLITVILWITSAWTKIPVSAVSGIPIVLLTMLGIIDADDVRTLPWDTLMLVAGGLALGLAVQEQGLVNHFINQIREFHVSGVMLVIIFALISVTVSNFMSNTAAVSILLPVSISIAAIIPGIEPSILPVVIGLSASCALALPVSTPPNAVAHSYGKLTQSEFLFGGLIMGIIGPLFITFWIFVLKGWM
jgi:sodium-dependent dicarboxylate transporter 2/3/5